MRKEIEEALGGVVELCRANRVRRLALFGSATRDDFEPAESDVDLLVEFDELTPAERARCYFDLLDALETLLSRNVDLVELEAIRNPYIRRAIEASRVILYEAA